MEPQNTSYDPAPAKKQTKKKQTKKKERKKEKRKKEQSSRILLYSYHQDKEY